MTTGCVMNVIRTTFWLSVLLLAQPCFAVKMDETTHDMVIQRLELGIDGMDKNEPEHNGILVRLAELYADRARLKAINQIETKCETCKGAGLDRSKAIALYQEALKGIPKPHQGKTVLQIAHLYGLNEEDAKANKLYIQIAKAKKGTYSSEVKALAYMNIGEIKFRKGDFKGALNEYQSARKENLKSRALVEFRIAWCQLNLGKTEKAIATLTNLLKHPDLLITQSTDGKNVDPAFVQDLSHDLAAFFAHTKVGLNEINTLKQLSPPAVRKQNLHTLATETDRLGKKDTALIVWAAYVDEGDVKANEKLEVQTRVAQIYYDMSKQQLAANAYEKALELWRKFGCNEPTLCDEIKTRLKKFVTAWNKSQKKEPSENLLRVYLAYIQTFPTDTEMLHWAGIVARTLNKHLQAAQLFHQAAVQASIDLKETPNKKELRNIFEGSLLAEIEMAEASKDPKVRENAYNYYLQINPNGSQAFEVRYQRAQVYYSANRYQDAFSEFHYLASQPAKDHRDLRVKSADLALDSLVALKDDQNIEVRSLEYARLFPERKIEYMKISRNATMNIVAVNLKKDNAKSDYKANLVELSKVNMDGAEDGEKIKFYKNKLAVAQKAMDLDAVRDSAQHLLAIRTLKAEDREWTTAQQVWVAELHLNFAEAYRLSKDMKMSELSKADRELRLALLADLAGLSAQKHHEAFLRLAGGTRAANLVRATLVKNARKPWNELDRQLKFLKQSPDLLAGLTLEVFAGHRDYKRAEHMLKSSIIGRYAAGQTLQRHLDLKEFEAFDRKIRSHRIIGSSDSTMQRTLKDRLKLLNDADKKTQVAFRRHDWTLQTLGLTQLARENRRLYHDIQNLPIPRRLSAADRAKYQQLMRTQSAPYLARAEKMESELNQIWSQSNSVQNLQAAYMSAPADLQKLYRDEITPLALNAPSAAKNRLNNLLNTPFRRPSQRDILLARRELQASPFDVAKVEHLRELESQNGRPSMVAYLDERLSQLRKGKTL